MTTAKANILIQANDRASSVLTRIAGRMEKVNHAARSIGQRTGFNRLTFGFRAIGAQLKPLANGLVAVDKFARGAAMSVAAVGAATYGMARFAKSANDAARKVDDLAQRYQVDTKTIQVVGAMVAESGGSMEDAAAAIGKLRKAQHEAINGNKDMAAAFQGVGLSVADLQKMTPDDVILRMADAFKDSTNAGAKQAIVLKTMGKSGEVMMQSLNGGAQNFRDQLAGMTADGRIFTQEQIEASRKFDEAWNRVAGAFEGIKNMVGFDLAEELTPIIDAVREWAVANRGVIKSKFKEFIEKIKPLMPAIRESFKAVARVGGLLVKVFFVLAKALSPLIRLLAKTISGIVDIAAAIGEFTGKVFDAGVAIAGDLCDGLKDLWTWLVDKTAPAFEFLGAAIEALHPVLDGILHPFDTLMDSLKGIWNFIIKVEQVVISLFAKLAKLSNTKAGNWLAEKMGMSADALNQLKFDTSAPGSGSDATSSAVAIAKSKKQDITNTLNIKIDAEGRARVAKMEAGSPQTRMNVKTGPAMALGS